MSGSLFDRLPNEMIVSISEYLGFNDLVTFSKICKRMNRIFNDTGDKIIETIDDILDRCILIDFSINPDNFMLTDKIFIIGSKKSIANCIREKYGREPSMREINYFDRQLIYGFKILHYNTDVEELSVIYIRDFIQYFFNVYNKILQYEIRKSRENDNTNRLSQLSYDELNKKLKTFYVLSSVFEYGLDDDEDGPELEYYIDEALEIFLDYMRNCSICKFFIYKEDYRMSREADDILLEKFKEIKKSKMKNLLNKKQYKKWKTNFV
jgi:hypothetical protein